MVNDFGGQDITDVGSLDTEQGPSKVYNASPGQVQSKIDDAASDTGGRGIVRLDASTDYDPASPWVVKAGVSIDCNGAIIRPTTDHDIFHILDRGMVIDPEVYLTNVTFTSNVFVFDSSIEGAAINTQRTGVDGGHTIGNRNGETVAYFHSTVDNPVVFCRVKSHDTKSVDKVMECVDDGSFCNSNVVEGNHEHHRIAMHCHGAGTTDANAIYGLIQPSSGYSEHGMYIQNGKGNHVVGRIWDAGKYSVASAEFTANAGRDNKLIDYYFVNQASVTNNSGTKSNGALAMTDIVMTGSDVGLGYNTTFSAADTQQTLIGDATTSSAQRTTALGCNTTASGPLGTTVGFGAEAGGYQLALGNNATATTAGNAIALGPGVTTQANGQAKIGADQLTWQTKNAQVADADLDNTEMTIDADETNGQFVFRYKDSTGTVKTATMSWS